MANEPKVLPYSGPAYPEGNFPTVYAESVMSLAHANGVVKFYLFRLEPSFKGDNTSATVPSLQVVMPYAGFVGAAVFFNRQMAAMLKLGALTQAQIDAVNASFDAQETAQSPPS
jgi:hypothetical protein